MKIIFLDVDGVMNSLRQWHRIKNEGKPDVPEGYRHIYPSYPSMAIGNFCDPEAIEALNFIVNETNAQIVVSSSWRDWDLGHLHLHFKWQGFTGPAFLDRTPLSLPVREGSPILLGMRRGHEIDFWLKNSAPEPIESFVILDDDADMDMHLPRLVQTNYDTGLTMELAHRALEKLSP